MVNLIEDKDKFFDKYNIEKEKFDKTGLMWDELREIYEDYSEQTHLLRVAGQNIAEILRVHPDAHSVRMRVKDPEHLIEKLIRKKIKNEKFTFDVKNYKERVTDLIGLRVLHLSKDDANYIDKAIRDNWNLAETATIYYRKGDLNDDEISNESQKTCNEKDLDFIYKEHPAGYRSWHYLIETNLTKEKYIAEIQVRTIFEEGWSEIDHKLRYPYNMDNERLNNQLMVLNRLAGSADEMVNSIKETITQFNKMNEVQEEQVKKIEELRNMIKQMGLEKHQSDSLLNKVDKIEEEQINYVIRDAVTAAVAQPIKGFTFKEQVKFANTLRNTLEAAEKFRHAKLNVHEKK